LAIQSNPANRSKYKRVFFIGSLVLMGFSILSKYQQWPGANLEGVLAIFFYCFAYAPLELYLKNAKWRQYSTNTWEMLLLSSLDFLGVNLILIGLLTRVLHWPGQYYLIYPGCVLLLAGLILWNLRFKKEVILRKLSEDKIKTQYQEIEREKQISDNLLLNILPAEVAEELKSKGHTEAKLFDEVTVLFTDFEDFTHHSEQMTAKELVAEINTCFSAFDQIMETFGVEKIKTIGDSYMCAGGLPVANNTHAVDVVNAGLAIQQFILNRMEQQAAIGIQPFQIRIGIHTGPVVAGIVGIKKFAYDIWGDTVNTASRMESNGQAGKVNISGTTYQLVKDHFAASHRGKIQVKGKGELDMYFVERNLRQA
jgi:class 3 adenylate cyclase